MQETKVAISNSYSGFIATMYVATALNINGSLTNLSLPNEQPTLKQVQFLVSAHTQKRVHLLLEAAASSKPAQGLRAVLLLRVIHLNPQILDNQMPPRDIQGQTAADTVELGDTLP